MMQKASTSLLLKYAPLYVRGFFEYHIKRRFGPLTPRELMFPITYRCDAKCVMCNIWKRPKQREISLTHINRLFSQELFQGIEAINITGGEPTLRDDLVAAVDILINSLPKLKKITLTTNALNPARVVARSTQIADLAGRHKVDFLVEASLDGIGNTHAKIRNVPNAFRSATETIMKIQQLSRSHSLRLGINTVISPANLHDVRNVYNWSKRHKVNTFFTIASTAENYFANASSENLKFKGEDTKHLVKFLMKLTAERSPTNFLAYYYQDLAKMIQTNQPRTTPCVFAMDAFVLDAFGDMYYCMKGKKIGNCLERNCAEIYFDPQNLVHRKEIISSKCPTCFINCFSSIGLGKEAIKYTKFLMSPLSTRT